MSLSEILKEVNLSKRLDLLKDNGLITYDYYLEEKVRLALTGAINPVTVNFDLAEKIVREVALNG